jgi:hypothetical protein
MEGIPQRSQPVPDALPTDAPVHEDAPHIVRAA